MAFSTTKFNWKILLLSFVLACGFWYTVTVLDRLEVQTEVTLNYRSMPDNLIVREGMLKSFTVQLRGPKELVKSLDAKMLSYSVDLSHLHRGTNVIALSAPITMAESRALDIMGTVPNQLTLEVEGIMDSIVPLEPRFSVPALAQALKAENLSVSPASVNVRGPESVIKKITGLKLDVPLEPTAPGEYRLALSVSTPPQVTAAPGTVTVRYSIVGKRMLAELERAPLLEAKNAKLYHIAPPKIMLTVELPEGLMGSRSYLEKIRVVVDAKNLPLSGSAEIKPSVELPEGARLVGISPARLKVTKNGK